LTEPSPDGCDRSTALAFFVIASLGLRPHLAAAQANGQLQIHQIRVGQGDAALIVSPMGQTLMIDSGPASASSCASSTGMITHLARIGLPHLYNHVAEPLRHGPHRCTDHIAAQTTSTITG